MDSDNPYAAPQVTLIDERLPQELAGWSVRQLQVLGWLCLVSIVITVMALAAAFVGGGAEASTVEVAGDWLSLLSTVLGCYLMLRLRAFLEQRFAASGLFVPVALIIVFSLLAELLDWLWGELIFTGLGWQTLCFIGVVLLMGVSTLWLGVALLRIPDAYPVLRVMAWLEIAGGVMFASIVLILIAIIPLLGGTLAMALVFFRAARDLQGQQPA